MFNCFGITSAKFDAGNVGSCFAIFETVSFTELYALAVTSCDCVATSSDLIFTFALIESPIYNIFDGHSVFKGVETLRAAFAGGGGGLVVGRVAGPPFEEGLDGVEVLEEGLGFNCTGLDVDEGFGDH